MDSFQGARSIPICLYGELKIKSKGEMFFYLATSRHDAPDKFASSFGTAVAHLRRNAKDVRHRVVGKDLESGFDTELVVEAGSRAAAVQVAERRGLDVAGVSLVN
jgi:hypothetical protein